MAINLVLPRLDYCAEYSMQIRSMAITRTQMNGPAESTSKQILNGLKKRLGEVKGLWADEHPIIIWSIQKNEKSVIGKYGFKAMLPVEVTIDTHRVTTF